MSRSSSAFARSSPSFFVVELLRERRIGQLGERMRGGVERQRLEVGERLAAGLVAVVDALLAVPVGAQRREHAVVQLRQLRLLLPFALQVDAELAQKRDEVGVEPAEPPVPAGIERDPPEDRECVVSELGDLAALRVLEPERAALRVHPDLLGRKLHAAIEIEPVEDRVRGVAPRASRGARESTFANS